MCLQRSHLQTQAGAAGSSAGSDCCGSLRFSLYSTRTTVWPLRQLRVYQIAEINDKRKSQPLLLLLSSEVTRTCRHRVPPSRGQDTQPAKPGCCSLMQRPSAVWPGPLRSPRCTQPGTGTLVTRTPSSRDFPARTNTFTSLPRLPLVKT